MSNTALKYKLSKELIGNFDNKLKIVRKYRGVTQEQLSAQTGIDQERIEFIETHKIELLEPDLCQLAATLQIDAELLLDNSMLLSQQESMFFHLIFSQIKSLEERKFIQEQILNWLSIILHNRKKEWIANRQTSVEILYSMDKKTEAIKRGKARDKKYASFREYFKNLQEQRYIKYLKQGKIMSANSFVVWFLEHLPKDVEIPYRKSNLKNKLIQLAQANNREFKKAFECKS